MSKKIQSATFFLKWENIATGHKFTSEYAYSKRLSKKTFVGYKNSCIAFGKNNGFKYLGEYKPTTRENRPEH